MLRAPWKDRKASGKGARSRVPACTRVIATGGPAWVSPRSLGWKRDRPLLVPIQTVPSPPARKARPSQSSQISPSDWP